MNLKERLTGFLLMCAVVPMAFMGWMYLWYVGLMGQTAKGRAGVRALDHFVNATLFGGYAWESVSSHAWRVRETHWWARQVIRLTDRFEKGHCMKANRREQPVVDLVLAKGLHRQTVGKPKATPSAQSDAGVPAVDRPETAA